MSASYSAMHIVLNYLILFILSRLIPLFSWYQSDCHDHICRESLFYIKHYFFSCIKKKKRNMLSKCIFLDMVFLNPWGKAKIKRENAYKDICGSHSASIFSV